MIRSVVDAVALALVAVALIGTMVAQVRPLRRGRALLDLLAVVPEWRFYAQESIGGAADLASDTHLIVRDRDAVGRIGGWRLVLSPAERRLHHALWNPRGRSEGQILSIGEDLADAVTRDGSGANIQQSLGYLALLRRAMAAPVAATGTDLQFAVVRTVGRAGRSASIGFLSAWHRR